MDLAQAGTKLFIAKFLGAMISFLGIVYFARELGATELGVFFLFQALLGMSSVLSNLGTRGAVEKRVSEGSVPEEILSTGVVLKIGLLILTGGLIILLGGPINQYIGASLAGLLVVAMLFQELGHFSSSILKGELRVGETAALKLINKIVWIGAGVVFVSYGYGVYGLVYGVIAGFLAKFLLGWYKISLGLGAPSLEHARSIWDYSKYAILPSLDQYLHNWTDILILGLFVTSAAVGAYEVSWRILTPIFMLTTAVGATIFPQISAWDANQESEKIEEVLPKALIPALILVLPAFCGAVLLSSEILSLLFGEGFDAAALALPILVLGLIPRALRTVTGKTLLGIDRPDLVTRAAVIDIVANILFNIILVWQFGIVGAAIATSLSYTIGAGLRWYFLDHFLTLRIPYRKIGWCGLSSLGMTLILIGIQMMISIETLPALFGVVGIGVVTYTVIIMLYHPLRSTVMEHTERLIRSAA